MSETALSTPARRRILFAIKATHSLAFFVIQSAILYLVYSGLRRRSDKAAAAAFAIAAGETAVYAGNRFRCPLRQLAENLGEERGSVTDIFLPQWLASNIARIYGPLFAIGTLLHVRNLLDQRRSTASPKWLPEEAS
jgi:hypothetical protein